MHNIQLEKYFKNQIKFYNPIALTPQYSNRKNNFQLYRYNRKLLIVDSESVIVCEEGVKINRVRMEYYRIFFQYTNAITYCVQCTIYMETLIDFPSY